MGNESNAYAMPGDGDEDADEEEAKDPAEEDGGKPAKTLATAVNADMGDGSNASTLLEEEVEEEDEEDGKQIKGEDPDGKKWRARPSRSL